MTKMISGLLGSGHGWFGEFSETAVDLDTEQRKKLDVLTDSRMIDG